MYARQYSRQGGTNRPRIQQDRNGADDPSISISQHQNTYEMTTSYYHPTEDVSYQYNSTNNNYVNDNMVSIIPTQANQHESNQYSIQNEYDGHDVNTTCVHLNTGTNTIVNTTINDEYHHVDNDDDEQEITTTEVILRIESMIVSIIQALDDMILPEMVQYNDASSNNLEDPSTNQPNNDTNCNDDNENDDGGIPGNSIMKKRFTMQQCRSFTSMLLVLAYCHTLLQSDDDDNNQNNDNIRRTTTTTREVYYYYVTHFRSQRECDMTIWDVCTLLQVPRHSLGLQASSKGWFCGNVQLIDTMNHTIQWNGYTYRGEQGCPISSEWLLPKSKRRIRLHSTNHYNNNGNHNHESNTTMDNDISCILIIEKEGIYQRLVQDGFWYKHNCILVTGKGFPDIATRAFVYNAFHQYNHIPVYGLADCDPFGIAILHCYSNNSNISGGIGTATTTTTTAATDGRGDRYSVPLYWLGLRPSQVQYLSKPTTFYNITYPALPLAVYQELTDIDRKRLINHFWNNELHSFVLNQHPGRKVEIQNMISMKVELEALYWLGMDFCSMFVGLLLDHAKQQLRIDGSVSPNSRDRPLNYQNDNAHSEYSELSWMDII